MSSFSDILDKRSSEIEAPKALPPGSYLGIVDGRHKDIKSPDKGTDGLQFDIRLVSPIQVADQEMLTSAGGAANKVVPNRFYLSDNNAFFLKAFLKDHLGIEEGTKSLRQMLDEAPGKQVGVNVKNTLTKGNDPRIIHVLDGTFKV